MNPEPPAPAAPPSAESAPPSPAPWRLLLLVMLLDAAVILPALGSRTLWQIDESRLAQVAREMAGTGDWLIPRIGGEPYACYPPLAYWAMAASGSLFGWTEWAMRLPGALAGVLLVGLAGALAWRLTASRLAAAGAAVALASTPGFVQQQITARADVMVALFATAALFEFDVIVRDGARAARLAGFYACAALGILAKGPLGLALPGVVLAAWIALRRRWDWIAALKPWWGLPAVLLVVAPWYWLLARSGGGGALSENLLVENVEAFVSGHSHPQPFYFYLLRTPGRALPWLLALLALPWLPRVRKESLFASAGVLALLVLLSVSTSKRLNYATYFYPLLAVVEGIAAAALLEEPRVRRAAAWTLAALSAAALLGLASLAATSIWTAKAMLVAREPLMAACLSAAVAFAAVAGLLARGRPGQALGGLGLALASLLAFHACVIEPRLDTEGPKGVAFCRAAGGLVPEGETIGAIGTETKAFYYFYIPRRMVHCGTREAFLARGFRYGFSLEPDRPEGTEPLAAYRGEDPDDPPQVLWRRTP